MELRFTITKEPNENHNPNNKRFTSHGVCNVEKEMNGELGEIYTVVNDIRIDIAIVKTKQQDNHITNQKDISRLYKWLWALSFIIISASLTVTLQAVAG